MRVARLLYDYEDQRQAHLVKLIAAEERRALRQSEPVRIPELPDLLGALSSKSRLRIIRHVALHPGDVTSIAGALGMTLPGVSQHLRILARHSLVASITRRSHHDYRLSRFVQAEVGDGGIGFQLRIQRATGEWLVLHWDS